MPKLLRQQVDPESNNKVLEEIVRVCFAGNLSAKHTYYKIQEHSRKKNGRKYNSFAK